MPQRILVIDNDEDVLDVFYEALDYEGFTVECTRGTMDIIKLVKDLRPDVLLIDYILDGINGGELCAQVKAHPDTCSLPVIIISAYSKVLISLGNYGCDIFIPKPFDLEDLVFKIRSLMTSSEEAPN